MLNFEDENTFELLVQACTKHAVSPLSSLESETFFRQLLDQYDGDNDATQIMQWLEAKICCLFTYLEYPPKWIQSPEWPIEHGVPMIFAGQIDISLKAIRPISHVFHDDTSLYVFISSNAVPRVIIQQF